MSCQAKVMDDEQGLDKCWDCRGPVVGEEADCELCVGEPAIGRRFSRNLNAFEVARETIEAL